MTCVLAALLASRSSGGAYLLLPVSWGTASTRPLSAQSDLGGLFIKYKYTDLFHLKCIARLNPCISRSRPAQDNQTKAVIR